MINYNKKSKNLQKLYHPFSLRSTPPYLLYAQHGNAESQKSRVAGAARSRPFWLELEPEPEFVRARAGAENFKNGWLGNPGNNRREKLDQCFGSNPDPKH